jgi:hypothetical protein
MALGYLIGTQVFSSMVAMVRLTLGSSRTVTENRAWLRRQAAMNVLA